MLVVRWMTISQTRLLQLVRSYSKNISLKPKKKARRPVIFVKKDGVKECFVYVAFSELLSEIFVDATARFSLIVVA